MPNGDFKLGPKASDMRGTVVLGRYAVPKWEISGFVEYIKSGQKQGDMLLVVPEGAFAVRLGNEASIKQGMRVARGMYYSITFSAARTCAQEEKLNISVAPDWGVLPMQTLYSSSGWDSYAWAFQAERDVAEIVIHNPGVEEDPACGPLIDSVAIRALYPPRASSSKEPFHRIRLSKLLIEQTSCLYTLLFHSNASVRVHWQCNFWSFSGVSTEIPTQLSCDHQIRTSMSGLLQFSVSDEFVHLCVMNELCREPVEEWEFRGRSLRFPERVVGRPDPSEH